MRKNLLDFSVLICGSLSETVLWTNPSPTAAFVDQTITIPDIDNYTYIKLVFRNNTSDASELINILPVDNIKANMVKRSAFLGIMFHISGDTWYYRNVGFTSTSVRISDVAPSGSGGRALIPVQIIGLK